MAGYDAGMPIQDRHVARLREIYQNEFGRELPVNEAWAMAHRLVTLVKVLQNEDDGLGRIADRRSLPSRKRDDHSEQRQFKV